MLFSFLIFFLIFVAELRSKSWKAVTEAELCVSLAGPGRSRPGGGCAGAAVSALPSVRGRAGAAVPSAQLSPSRLGDRSSGC